MKKVIYCLLSKIVLLALLASFVGCAGRAAYPLATAKMRFKVATTTSLYDTGLWAFLEPKFEEKYKDYKAEEQEIPRVGIELDIVYAGTGAALNQGKSGNVDVVAVHDPDQEKTFVSDNYGIDKRSFAYNFFMIAGPSSDPAGIKGLDLADAFKKIAEGGMKDPDKIKFVSRGDNSGTHGAEKRLWAAAGYVYADIEKSGKWYIEAGQGMGPTLVMANELNAYVLCDGGTFTVLQGRLTLVPLVKKIAAETLNVYNVYAINPDKIKTAKIAIAKEFINWLISLDVQKMIGEYGVKEFGGPLFYPIGDTTYPAIPNLTDNMKPVQ